jgi:hypothetical protein
MQSGPGASPLEVGTLLTPSGKMGLAAKWRKQLEDEDSFTLRERSLPYGDDFEAKKSDIGHQNTYSWNWFLVIFIC